MRYIKNWKKFQHFHHKTEMKWFKLYGELLNNIDWHKLSSDNKSTLLEFWCLASEEGGALPENEVIAFRLRKPVDFIENQINELDNWIIYSDAEELYSTYITDKIRLEDNISTLDGFNEFWISYPAARKVGKKPCQDKWVKKGLYKIKDEIINHVRLMSDSKQWKDGYSPNPLTYLNQERYNDTVEVNDPFAGAL